MIAAVWASHVPHAVLFLGPPIAAVVTVVAGQRHHDASPPVPTSDAAMAGWEELAER
jgi:hypothetical protein